MAQAYDFALDKMGMDISSFPLWNDYIKFLKGVEAMGSYAENQKITAIRKVYQRGIVNPMINIEQLWYVTVLVNSISSTETLSDSAKSNFQVVFFFFFFFFSLLSSLTFSLAKRPSWNQADFFFRTQQRNPFDHFSPPPPPFPRRIKKIFFFFWILKKSA